jgi:signal transduction histidine kinase
MKLSTRLSIVVTLLLTVVSLTVGAFSIYTNRSTQIQTYDEVLKLAVADLTNSDEDPFSNSLVVAENSTIPMSLVYITNSNDISYLAENAGNIDSKPTANQIATGLKSSIQISGYRARFIKVSQGETLGILISTQTIDAATSKAWKKIIYFDLAAIILGGLLTALLFRRDSKINANARAMQEFIGDASHELKTPLTVIRGYSELLMKENSYASRIHEESLRMGRIIDDLLLIAALDEGKHSEAIDIDISPIIQKEVDDLGVLQSERNIEAVLTPLVVHGERKVLDSLFSNIFTNIKVHTPANAPVRITVGDNQVIIEDGGPGLKEIPTKPFERFDSSRSRETGGSGLGMSIIQKSIAHLGGKVSFSKSELGGLKVTLKFK